MKKIKILLFLLMMGAILPTTVQAMTFEQARETAIQNSQKIKLQDKIVSQVEKKYEKQKDDHTQNNPDYIYEGMTKIPVYNHSYPTYDYEEILKQQKDIRRDMLIENENKTLKLFIDILNTSQDIKDITLQIENQKNIVNQTKSKYENGQVIKLEVQRQENILKQNIDRLKKLQSTKKLQERKFNQHLNIDPENKVSLELIEPNLKIEIPKQVYDKSIENIKQYRDLKDELKDLDDDMKWIQDISASYYVDKQEEKIQDKKDDIKEYKRQTKYNYEMIYEKIKIKLNSIKNKKIELRQLKRQKEVYQALYKQGLINKNNIDSTKALENKNLIDQTKLSLEISQLLDDYYREIKGI